MQRKPYQRTILVVAALLLALRDAESLSAPSSSSYCSKGGKKRADSGGVCSCVGNVYYCANGKGGPCRGPKYVSGSINCANSVFSDPRYKSRKYCYCEKLGCNAGQKGPAGSCSACAAGQYQSQNEFTGSSCTNCPAGQFQNGNGASGCKNCGSGKYASGTGNTGCNIVFGRAVPKVRSKSSCSNCASGKYNTGTGNTGCTNCANGQYQNSEGSQVAKIVAVGSTKMARRGVVAWSVPKASTKPTPEKIRAMNVGRGTTNPAKGRPAASSASKVNMQMRMAPKAAMIAGSADTVAQGGCRRLAAAGLAKLVISATVAAPPIHRRIVRRGKRRSQIRSEQNTTVKKAKRVGSSTLTTTRYQREMRTWITGKHNFHAPINITASTVLPSQSCCGPPAMAVHLVWLGKL